MTLSPKPRIVLGAASALAVSHFIAQQAVYLSESGWSVVIVSSPDEGFSRVRDFVAHEPSISLVAIPMQRGPAPMKDFVALLRWVRLLKRVKPDVILVGTPKAGMLGIAAGFVLGIRPRLYLLRGLRLETQRGVARLISRVIETLVSGMSTRVLAVSPSLKEEYADLNLARKDKITVIGHGSSNGVDTRFFRPPTSSERERARHALGISDSSLVLGFIGRLTCDKGVKTLIQAASAVMLDYPEVQLLIAGASEGSVNVVSAEVGDDIRERVKIVPWTTDPRSMLWAIDVFCLPSMREGMPNVNLEAAATGLAVITSDATGCRDSVEPSITGLIAQRGNVNALSSAIRILIENPTERRVMGQKARIWVAARFEQEKVWSALNAWLKLQVRSCR